MCEWLDIEYKPILIEVTQLHGAPKEIQGWSMDGPS